jgi:CzcA family heavy metal efflux pump
MKYLENVIHFSIKRRFIVITLALLVSSYGYYNYKNMEVDVFPNLSAPSITIITETNKMAPEETETFVTLPIEKSLNGASKVRRTRSVSGYGYSIVWVDFQWGMDLNLARQIVIEKLQIARSQLPKNISQPVISPETSIMGEILTFGLVGTNVSGLELMDTAKRTIRRNLKQIPGVAQIFCSGGILGLWNVNVNPYKLIFYNISLNDVYKALKESGDNGSGGFWVKGSQESMIRVIGQLQNKQDIENIVVKVIKGVPITIRQISKVSLGHAQKRGDASINGKPGVVITIIKQPKANTLILTKKLDLALKDLKKSLPPNMEIKENLFNQAQFINRSISNVTKSLRDGAILIVIVLFLFMMDLKTTFISLTALPLSIFLAFSMMHFANISINTMTLGGLTLSIGVLIDDCIIGVENSWRRLKENKSLPLKKQISIFKVIFKASKEVLNSVVFANILIILVFVPIFFIGGMEGRLISPLGFAYMAANFASLLVSITVTPALTALLFAKGNFKTKGDSFLIKFLKKIYNPVIKFTLKHNPIFILVFCFLMIGTSIWMATTIGRRFLPQWNEGALNITALTLPGTSLNESNRLATKVELSLLSIPEVVSTARRTGRTELDEHAMDVSASEIEVKLKMKKRSKSGMLKEMREKLKKIQGIKTQIGQPLSHRIDHMLSGSRSSLAVKIVGQNLNELRRIAKDVSLVMATISGVVDIAVEPVVNLHQKHIKLKTYNMSQAGIRSNHVINFVETAIYGKKVSTVYNEGWKRDLILTVQKEGSYNEVFEHLFINSPVLGQIPLTYIAKTEDVMGPNVILHENGLRRILVTANFSKSDTVGIVKKIKASINSQVYIPDGYYVIYGGQFESEKRATTALVWSILFIILTIGIILIIAFGSISKALLMLINLPFAFVGGVTALWYSHTPFSVASMLGFITLFGIATRNGLILVSHFTYLKLEKKLPLEKTVLTGSIERLSPILMTALTSVLALLPLVLSSNTTGNEIQSPMGIVILGGLFTSTILSLLVFPCFYYHMAKKFNW